MILSMIDVIVTVVWDSDVIIRLPSRTSCVVCFALRKRVIKSLRSCNAF